MYRMAVVDDEKVYREHVRKIAEETIYEQGIHMDVMCFHSAGSLIEEIEDGIRFFAYVLDIEMPGMNGIELAKYIRKVDENAYIIFLTSYSEFAIAGYDVHAYQYVLKDSLKEKMEAMLKQIWAESGIVNDGRYYTILTNSRREKIRISDIVRIYKDGKNVQFVTEKGLFQQRTSLNEVFDLLPREEFVFNERGSIVNLRCVEQIVKNEIILSDHTILAVGRTHLAEVKRAITKYWGKRI